MFVLSRASLRFNKTTDFYPTSILINSRCPKELLKSSKKTTSLLTTRVILNFRNKYNQVPRAYFSANYTMEYTCVIFTPQEDQSTLKTIGELVSFNKLLCSTTNHKRYAGTSVLYKETWILVTALALLLSCFEKATRNWRRIQLFGSETGIAPKAWQTVHFRTLPWRS